MRNKKLLLIFTILLLLMLGASAVLASPAALEITRFVIAGGGGSASSGAYALDGTIGQSVVGKILTSPYEACAGFWCQAAEYAVYLPSVLKTNP